MYGGYVHPHEDDPAPVSFDTVTVQKSVLAAFAREVGIPMTMTLPEGMKWYLRTQGLDEDHVERTYARLRTQEIPTTTAEIRAQIAEAIEAAR